MNCDGLQIFRTLVLAVCLLFLPGLASGIGTPVAVFPLQELKEGRNDANLQFTRTLIEKLAENDNEVIGLETIITFMANNRIRTVGHLETINISWARRDLAVGFVLIGTVTQQKEKPSPSLGLVLNLVRTSDFRIVWSYIGSVSTSEERRVLGIAEPDSTAQLQQILLDEILEKWPWQIIKEEPQVGSLNIDSAILEPKFVRPGDEIHSRVRLRNTWPAGQEPRVFFKADDQLYPATFAADGFSYEATWVAGEQSGRFPVTLLLEWPYYGRTEMAKLGTYVVDATPPLFEIELRGVKYVENMPVFNQEVVIMPRMIVRKPLDRWHLAIYFENDSPPVGDMNGSGNLPERIIWKGRGRVEDGMYEIVIEAWDKAGNSAIARKNVVMDRSVPQVDLALERSEDELVVDLEQIGKVPLRYWRLEMWTKEGRILTQTEGQELPGEISIQLPPSSQDQEIEGFLFYEDILGKRVRKKVEDFLPKLGKKPAAEAEEPKGISKKWVDEF